MKSLKSKHIDTIKDWLKNSQKLPVQYPDITGPIIDHILLKHLQPTQEPKEVITSPTYSLKKFKDLHLGKLIHQI